MPGHNTLAELTAALNYQRIPDPGNAGAIPPVTGLCNLQSSGTETRTLAAPSRPGLFMLVNFQSDGGGITLTVADTFNGADNTIVAFADEGDAVILISVTVGSGTGNDADYQWCVFDGTGGPAFV